MVGGKAARQGKGPLWVFKNQENGSFSTPHADYLSRLYFPLMNSAGMKSWVNPQLKGDVCTSFSHYLTPPLVSEEMDKTLSSRNIWITVDGHKPWSATGMSAWQKAEKWAENQDYSEVQAQPGIFSLHRQNTERAIRSEIVVFVPNSKDTVELLWVKIENTGTSAINLQLTYSIPLFGRHADNFRDHREVTSMFQQVFKESHGVRVKPNIVHDEHGHRANHTNYMVLGADEQGLAPEQIWLDMVDFTGEGGSLDNPEAVFLHKKPSDLFAENNHGREAIGAFRFAKITLNPGQTLSYILMNGISENEKESAQWPAHFGHKSGVSQAFAKTKSYWENYTQRIKIQTASTDFDEWAQWVIYQVKARQEFGNSFLPDFSYGRGGRGWRDLWQDLLSVLLIDPGSARQEIINNFNGIRIDGSNATIIGFKPGEFIADRNNVPRSWSDHGAWPVFVTNFYLNQSGDYDLLFQKMPYWKDQFVHRCKRVDASWNRASGNWQLANNEEIYRGSIFEHLLVQQLSAFYTVGTHNILKLEGADWNDTYDMARENGETVGFYAFYAHNLLLMNEWLEVLQKNGQKSVDLFEELLVLIDRLDNQVKIDYSISGEKQQRIQEFFSRVENPLSGRVVQVNIDDLKIDLHEKAQHVLSLIAQQEWIQFADNAGFFNGHYDNLGQAIGGYSSQKKQIDLTTQVMTILNQAASDERIPFIKQAVDELLTDTDTKGIRLCRPFSQLDLNVGRLTGFVYGYKEHGSKWLQQNVMLAYAMYTRGFNEFANQIIFDVFQLATDSATSKIFPGVPSYLEIGDRGAYAYLTGSSAWMMLSLTSQMFGVRGKKGDLILEPRIRPELFNEQGEASIELTFHEKRIRVVYVLKPIHKINRYMIGVVAVNNVPVILTKERAKSCIISSQYINENFDEELNVIKVFLQSE